MNRNRYRSLPRSAPTNGSLRRRCGLIRELLAACLLAAPTLAAPAPVRLAVLATDGVAETAALADLLTVSFGQTPGVETVERTELEQTLAALAADVLAKMTSLRAGSDNLPSAEPALLLSMGQKRGALQGGLWAMEAAYALDTTNLAVRSTLIGGSWGRWQLVFFPGKQTKDMEVMAWARESAN